MSNVVASLCTRCQRNPRAGTGQRWCRRCKTAQQREARQRKRTATLTTDTFALKNAAPVPILCESALKNAPRVETLRPVPPVEPCRPVRASMTPDALRVLAELRLLMHEYAQHNATGWRHSLIPPHVAFRQIQRLWHRCRELGLMENR